MQGKTVVITGGTGGIGLVAAERLAGAGARLVLVGRDRRRGEAAAARVPGAELHYADLALMAEARRLAAALAALPRIDVLILNAGAIFARREVTAEGLERTFALNHMHYFLLAHGLLEKLKAAAPARILLVASEAHRGAHLDFDDLQSARGYRAWPAYRRSKLCNILLARELARRLEGSGVTANALHPGFVATGFGARNPLAFRAALGLAKRFMAIPAEAGARPIVELAQAPALATASGRYFDKGVERRPAPEAEDAAVARRLWDASARLAGLAP
jgi:NAD(P)-dependent dehydrogenase (short-subunit alcohol dehydrogenase family)